ncbi:hypothetical protein BG011_007537 [Mortierella polycephala]|uniref:Uncharacterized protein n=1 Tax=Mortierella polycephala TaxID=41804 RepID=A0A9P6PSE7_9FUNG|nr:hypothetical protein BG011_007537 [Mortierella polycephala]
MAVNWVTLTADGKDFVRLENENVFNQEQGARFELDSSNGGYPGAGATYASKSGTLFLTNQRLVYLCASPTPFFSSASLPINNIQDSKLAQSWFSAPVFKAVVTPVPGGGLAQPARLSITFTKGKLDGEAPQHLEQLPVYVPSSDPIPNPSGTTGVVPMPTPTATISAFIPQPQPLPRAQPVTQTAAPTQAPPPQPLPQAAPSDLPPSYDEIC